MLVPFWFPIFNFGSIVVPKFNFGSILVPFGSILVPCWFHLEPFGPRPAPARRGLARPGRPAQPGRPASPARSGQAWPGLARPDVLILGPKHAQSDYILAKVRQHTTPQLTSGPTRSNIQRAPTYSTRHRNRPTHELKPAHAVAPLATRQHGPSLIHE